MKIQPGRTCHDKQIEFRECNRKHPKQCTNSRCENHLFCSLELTGEPHDADIIFISHEHYDHFSPKDIEKAANKDTWIVFPYSMESRISETCIAADRQYAIKPGDKVGIPEIKVEAVPAYNKMKPFHPKRNDWDAQLSPWPARSAFGDEPFRGKGTDTLSWLTGRCIPELKADGLVANDVPQYIAGYSLSGLFALWSLLESDMFDGAASCSGSLWLDGWMDYVRSKKISHDVSVYLSLGSKEERTKNPLMQTVGDCTRVTYEHFR